MHDFSTSLTDIVRQLVHHIEDGVDVGGVVHDGAEGLQNGAGNDLSEEKRKRRYVKNV